MKRVLKWLLMLVLAVVGCVIVFVGYVYVRTNALMDRTYIVNTPKVTVVNDAAAIARGKYLAEKVSMCVECHGADLGGKVMMDNFPMGKLASSNLTRGRGGLGATYTDEDLVRALVHGVRKDGRSVIFMPSQDYHFTEQDVASLVAYIRSVPPVDRERPEVRIGPMARVLGWSGVFPLFPGNMIDHQHVAFAPAKDPADAVASGEYLMSTAGCRGCHGPELTGGLGPPPGGANITPVGIGDWTEQDFFRALREHKRPNGTTIADEMPRAFGQMSDDDLRKIFTYLRTVPAKGQKTKNQLKTS
jgi:cytochrome c553